MMIKYILFDFDGTLVNTNDVILASWQHTYKHYLGHEIDVKHITQSFGEPLHVTIVRELPHIDPKESSEVYRAYQVEHADELVKIFPGIKETLQGLKEAGYTIGLVTSRAKESAVRYLTRFGIESYFDDMVTCEDTNVHKPDPQPLLLCLEKLGAKAEEALMIGDSQYDIRCATNAGVKSVLVGWRVTDDSTPYVEQAKEDYTIEEPMDLLDLLKNLGA